MDKVVIAEQIKAKYPKVFHDEWNTSLDEFVADMIKYKCGIVDIWHEFGISVAEVTDFNMWVGFVAIEGLVDLSRLDKVCEDTYNNAWGC